jgi:hypothetical protein
MKKYYYLSIATLSVIFITGVSLVFAQSWEAPAGPPPVNNTSPAINVSDLTQTKAGNLWAANLLSEGDVYVNQSVVAPNTIETAVNTKILTFNSVSSWLEWREAGPWAAGNIGSVPGGYERIIAPPGNPSIANCSPAKKVVGGGCGPEDDHNDFNSGYGYPDTDQSYWCNNPDNIPVVAYAICMSGI